MERCDKLTGSLWFFFGLFIAIKGADIGIGSLPNPGPGFIFFLGGIFICLLSVIVFIKANRIITEAEKKSIFWEGIRWGKLAGVIISLIFFGYFLEKIGYILSILLLMFYLLKGIEPQKWHIAILSSVLTCLFVYVVFVLWLQSQLPKGILPF